MFIVISNVLQGKEVSVLFKDTEPPTSDIETWEVGKNTSYETEHLNSKTIRLCAKDSQLIVKKPPLKKAKKFTFGKHSLIFENTDRTKTSIKKEVLLSKTKKKNQVKIVKFLKSRNQTHARKTHEDKSLSKYAEQKSKSLKVTLALYFIAGCLIIGGPFGTNELQKFLNGDDLTQERFLKLEYLNFSLFKKSFDFLKFKDKKLESNKDH